MSRKDKPLKKRIVNSIGSLALIGTGGYIFIAGLNMFTVLIFAIAFLSICTPVIIEGGSIIELLIGIVEAFVEGVMAVVEAIVSIFNF